MAWLFKPDGTIHKVKDDLPDKEAREGYWLYDLIDSDEYAWWSGTASEQFGYHWEKKNIEDIPNIIKAKLLLLKE